jgi:hypothetical protein
MKRIGILVLSLSILLPSPAQAFFNRDCSNLKKRVSINQVKSEKAWDKYQAALGRYKAIKNPSFSADEEVRNRLRLTYASIEVILLDMTKYPKCLAQSIDVVNKNLSDVRKRKSEYVLFKWGGSPLPELFDLRTYLK